MIKNGLNPKFKNSCLGNKASAFQAQRCSLSAPIRNYGDILPESCMKINEKFE